MSEWGAILDRVIVLAQAAVPELATAGRTERGIRVAEKLLPGEFPHLFAYDPRDSVALLPQLQERVTTTVILLLVTRDETQEATAQKADAIRDAIRGDPTLAGAVESCHVSERTLREHPDVAYRGAGFLVTAFREGS